VAIVAVIFFVKSTDMSASIMKLSSKSMRTQDTCYETDSSKEYEEAGDITVVINGHTRVEHDTCNAN
jgi:mevalonate pyrophosphate decarboxylase